MLLLLCIFHVESFRIINVSQPIIFLELYRGKDTLIDQPWSTIIEPLEKISNPLGYAWGVTSHLNRVCNSQELRDVYQKVY